jgi:hypothetical protein
VRCGVVAGQTLQGNGDRVVQPTWNSYRDSGAAHGSMDHAGSDGHQATPDCVNAVPFASSICSRHRTTDAHLSGLSGGKLSQSFTGVFVAAFDVSIVSFGTGSATLGLGILHMGMPARMLNRGRGGSVKLHGG